MSAKQGLKEVIPTSGMLFHELKLYPVLCKPKLMPLKSVTLEKLERMQREAQEKIWELEKDILTEPPEAVVEAEGPAQAADVWNPDDEATEDKDDRDDTI